MGSAADELERGDSVTLTGRHLGFRFRMTAVITTYERPQRFVDEQVDGPFAWWRHEHTFDAADGGTRMTDRIDYRLPLGPLGSVVDAVAVRRHLRRIIAERNSWLRASLESPG